MYVYIEDSICTFWTPDAAIVARHDSKLNTPPASKLFFSCDACTYIEGSGAWSKHAFLKLRFWHCTKPHCFHVFC